ncbi:RNA-binding domain-containing protein [Labilibacter marinus]|uniref:RNA-binding domain-containing protein n=1 Tax=Labilibacter marinus TaxID=1477105 RepID=UPI00094FC81F|nr:transporter substrate-binding domain-containing protein [Labilibacter marinus]
MRKLSLSILLSLLSIFIYSSKLEGKTYKIACLHDYYPYTAINDQGEASGIAIDWWKLWSEKSGIDVEFVPSDVNNIGDLLLQGEVDAIAGLYYTEDRTDIIEFSDPILRLRSVVFLKEEFEVSTNLTAEITVLDKSTAIKELGKRYPNLKIKKVDSFSLVREEAHLKQCDGFVYDIPNTLGTYKGFDTPDGYYEFATLFTSQLRPAVKKGNQEVLLNIMSGSSKISTEELIAMAKKYKLYKESRSMYWVALFVFICLVFSLFMFWMYMKKQKKRNKKLMEFEAGTDWQVILDKGENDLIEFKSSMRWDYRQEKPNKALEMVIIKTISAFLNTEGGMLFIGVDDDGNTLGLENDYNSYSKKSRDGFLLGLTNLINQHLGKRIHSFLNINIISINDKDVCIVNIEKGDKPAFIGKGDKEEFYIRTSASSQPLSMRESYEYIDSHWKK